MRAQAVREALHHFLAVFKGWDVMEKTKGDDEMISVCG